MERPPTVAPLAPSPERPYWLGMILIYNCREIYLRETVQSGLHQDPHGTNMQIEVLDNCSTVSDPEKLVGEIGGGRVAFHRQTHNLGIAGNVNACWDAAALDWNLVEARRRSQRHPLRARAACVLPASCRRRQQLPCRDRRECEVERRSKLPFASAATLSPRPTRRQARETA